MDAEPGGILYLQEFFSDSVGDNDWIVGEKRTL